MHSPNEIWEVLFLEEKITPDFIVCMFGKRSFPEARSLFMGAFRGEMLKGAVLL